MKVTYIKQKSPAMLWASEDEECPNCGDITSPLWFLECCGMIMCDTCKDKHDEKQGFLVN